MKEDDPQCGLLGRLGVYYGLITPEQLAEAMRIQGQYGNTRRLGEILLEKGFVDQAELDRLLYLQRLYLERHSLAAKKAPDRPRISDGAFGERREPAIRRILAVAKKVGASDVHIHAGAPVMLRVAGQLASVKMPALEPAQTERLIGDLLSPEEQKALAETGDLELALDVSGIGRFRASLYRERRGFGAVLRAIPEKPPDLDGLRLPGMVARVAAFREGLVLVTGPSGCGKSSTLAALVRLINEDRRDHIVTVEAPVEFVHESLCCIVNQREVRRHTDSFAAALRAALCEDPDIIVAGELWDVETVTLALGAAETGHFVMATLHISGAARAISHIIELFPPADQPHVRSMLAGALRAVIYQQLVPTADGHGLVPAVEILMVTPGVARLIREDRPDEIQALLLAHRAHGMCAMDDSLAELVRSGMVRQEVARCFASDPRRFD